MKTLTSQFYSMSNEDKLKALTPIAFEITYKVFEGDMRAGGWSQNKTTVVNEILDVKPFIDSCQKSVVQVKPVFIHVFDSIISDDEINAVIEADKQSKLRISKESRVNKAKRELDLAEKDL